MEKIEPVAWVKTCPDDLIGEVIKSVTQNPNNSSWQPLYTREALEAVAKAVRDEVIQKITEGDILGVTGTVRKRAKNTDLSAIIDKILGE